MRSPAVLLIYKPYFGLRTRHPYYLRKGGAKIWEGKHVKRTDSVYVYLPKEGIEIMKLLTQVSSCSLIWEISNSKKGF